jgi:hypothetical protein
MAIESLADSASYLKGLGMRETSGTGDRKIEWRLDQAKVLTGTDIDSKVSVGAPQLTLPKGTEITVKRCLMVPTVVRGTTYETTYFECEVGGKTKMVPTSGLLQPLQIPRDAAEGQTKNIEKLSMALEGDHYDLNKAPSTVFADIVGKKIKIIDEITVDRMVTPNPEKGFDGKLRTTYRPFRIIAA